MLKLIVCILCFVNVSQAMLKVDLQKELNNLKVINLYDENKKPKSGTLSYVKYLQIQGDNKKCVQQALSQIKDNSSLQGWLLVVAAECALRHDQLDSLQPVSKALQSNQQILIYGPWVKELTAQWGSINQRILNLLSVEKNKTKAITHCESSLLFPQWLSKDFKSNCFQIMAEEAQLRKKETQAYSFYLLSYEQKPQKSIAEALQKLALKNDFKPILEDAKKESAASGLSLKNLDNDIDLEKWLDAAKSAHRRADYQQAQKWVDQLLSYTLPKSMLLSSLWIAGRNAQFMGQYDKAIYFFEQIQKKFPETDEFYESIFRLGLVYLRQKSFLQAKNTFENFLALPSHNAKSRYQLSSIYWLIRARQNLENKSSSAEIKKQTQDLIHKTIEDYPFSYYGLILQAEKNNGMVSQFTNSKLNLQKIKSPPLILIGDAANAWKRFKALVKAGWWSEAQQELLAVPQLNDLNYKIFLVQKFSQANLHLPAIQLVNQLMEFDPGLRSKEVLQWGYPQVFLSDFNLQAERQHINSYLLRSLTRQESGFNIRAISSSQALGLMQMIPPTAQEVAKDLGFKNLKIPEDMFKPKINIAMGSHYIKKMLQEFSGHVPMALAAYNAGPTRMKIWVELRPEVQTLRGQFETQPLDEVWFDELPWFESSFYIKAILRNMIIYQVLEKGSLSVQPAFWQERPEKKSARGG